MVQSAVPMVMVVIVTLGIGIGSGAAQTPPMPSGTPRWQPVPPGVTPTPTPQPDPRQAKAVHVGGELSAVDEALWMVFDARKEDGEAALLSAVDEHLALSRDRVKEAVRGFEVMQCRRDGAGAPASFVIGDADLRQVFLGAYLPAVTKFRAVRSEVEGDDELSALFDAARQRQADFQDAICTELEAEANRPKRIRPRTGAKDRPNASSF
jgi:hypothetical protein